ncbi:hypothetical protein HMI48_19120 [Acidithiobacillus ferrooxidans]|uniref:hypothetical protein n=1 Tax=Acidithiobacillus ferrooxidans TaxID=920 RepID=UPI001C075931|nr:hypothetical protein [Acidithiobacillus ferrooxidans]MBU2775895.1 hypothetical protein [Acidithiobacillus ferrooxidans]
MACKDACGFTERFPAVIAAFSACNCAIVAESPPSDKNWQGRKQGPKNRHTDLLFHARSPW